MTHYGKSVLYAGPSILWAYFAWMRKFAKHPEKYPEEVRYKKVRKLLIRLSDSFNVEYHVEGMENIPEEVCCFVSNHLSAYDPVALISCMEKPCTFVAKKELENKPFAGKIIESMAGLFLDRGDLKQSLRIMMKVEEDGGFGDESGEFPVLVADGQKAQVVAFDVGHGPVQVVVGGDHAPGRRHEVEDEERSEELGIEHGGEGPFGEDDALKESLFVHDGIDFAGGPPFFRGDVATKVT